MVYHGADAGTHQQRQDRHGCIGGHRQQRGERGGAAPGGDNQRGPPARQQPCVLSPTIGKIQNAGRGAGVDFAAANVEETLPNMWLLDDVEAALDSGWASLPLPNLLCRSTDEVLPEIQRDQRHLQPRRTTEKAHRQTSFGEVSHGNSTKKLEMSREGVLGPSSFGTQQLNQHLLLQQQQESQSEDGIPSFKMLNERRGDAHVMGPGNGNYPDVRTANGVNRQPGSYDQHPQGLDVLLPVDVSGNDAKASSDYCTGGLVLGGGDGCTGMHGSESGPCSPKSSISSDGSGGDPVGHSPAAVWEVGMRRGVGRGGGVRPAGRVRKRKSDAADDGVLGVRQPQTIPDIESVARLRDREMSLEGLKQLFLRANAEHGFPPSGGGEAMEENENSVKQLLQLLRVTSFERDEARDQLQKLLNKITQPVPLEHSPTLFYPDLPVVGRTRASSGVTAFDKPSQAHNYYPYALSPVESLFESPSSELPNRSMIDAAGTALAQQPPLPECNGSVPPGLRAQSVGFDPASAIIDRLVAKKGLPEKGKLLQAVMEAGPLLQTLLVAGSLPRWRNPPPLQPFQVSPVSVRAPEPSVLNQRAALNQNCLAQISPPLPKVFRRQNSLVASQMYAASSLGSSASSALCARGQVASTCAGSCHAPLGKRLDKF